MLAKGKSRSLPQLRVSINDNMRMQIAAGAQDNMFANDTVRSDATIRPDLALG